MGQAAEKHSEGLGTGVDIGVKAEHIMTSRERSQEQDILGFERRHLGPREAQVGEMCAFLGYDSLSHLIDAAVPASIRLQGAFQSKVFAAPLREHEALSKIQSLSKQNKTKRSFIGMGYHDTLTPTVILRNVFENPGWYTQYTPYQPEISQGRLEALLNFQTMISDLTGLPIVNASLLDEATAAAEAMTLSYGVKNKAGSHSSADTFFVSDGCHPQVIEVVKTRGEAVGIQVEVGCLNSFKPRKEYFGALFAYPTTNGSVIDIAPYIRDAHKEGLVVTVTTDPLALLLLKSPGSLGADVVVGSAQRFGVPLGFGGPHAAYMATKDEFKRVLPGRLVGVSRDATGKRALRLSLQTREQHIRREKATSNICTAQVLLANMAGMYAVYHGPVGLRKIAEEVHAKAALLVDYLTKAGMKLENDSYFDTLTVIASKSEQQEIKKRADAADVLLRYFDDGRVGISINETTTLNDVYDLAVLLTGKKGLPPVSPEVVGAGSTVLLRVPAGVIREDEPLSHPVFNRYHSESEFLRYIKLLEGKDISLTHSMIPLGSCTMKLNATSEMIPVTYPGFSALHPFAPLEDAKGYLQLFQDLEQALQEVTGFDAVSLQPNAGSQGEYAGLLAIRGYHLANNQAHRNVCLIPVSAHGTNPASAVMVGMQVVIIKCDDAGNIDLEDLKAKADEHKDNLAALMVTYPSTHGVFETTVQEACHIIHERGGQVYLDGANLNALVGLSRPGDIGADVCHINLHKTFCIPHGGGGPGMGPIGVKKHLQPFLPGHLFAENVLGRKEGAVSAAPWGSASILPISWMYMAMMGASGMQRATEVAILNANYIAKRLENHYPILYRGANGLVAHECILDARPLKESAGVEAVDIAKRLMDYGFHAPTMSWPVAGTLMVEPTESESKEELDRFCDAMISIAEEAKRIERGEWPRENNPLKNAPHTASVVMSDTWERPYSREVAVFPVQSLRESKFWPSVSRIEESYGDRNLVCTCPAVEEYA